MVLLRLWSIRGRGGVSLPRVYVHAAIYDMYAVYWCCIDLWSIGGGVGSVHHGYICILLYNKLMWSSGVT